MDSRAGAKTSPPWVAARAMHVKATLSRGIADGGPERLRAKAQPAFERVGHSLGSGSLSPKKEKEEKKEG